MRGAQWLTIPGDLQGKWQSNNEVCDRYDHNRL
jgi:hypothetical protein